MFFQARVPGPTTNLRGPGSHHKTKGSRPGSLPFGTKKLTLGPVDLLGQKENINGHFVWTLVKPNVELRPVSKTAETIQSHGGSGSPPCRKTTKIL